MISSVNPVSLVVITKDSEKTLSACLESAKNLVSETIVVDDYSNDKTREVATRHGAKVLIRELESCGKQKQFALEQASQEWIFLLDSDETCPPELANEISEIISRPRPETAYRLPRKNYYFGKWLRFGGKYPDYQTRLFRKNKARYSDHFSHEKVIVDGSLGTLRSWINHFAYPDIDTWFFKLKRTAEFDALEWERNGVRLSSFNMIRLCIVKPSWRFVKRYFLIGGFLDGVPGILACLHDALTQILTYHILSRKTPDQKAPSRPKQNKMGPA